LCYRIIKIDAVAPKDVMTRLALLIASMVLAGCGSGTTSCRVDSECGAGQTCLDGTCIKSSDVDLATKLQTPQDLAGADLALPGAPDGFSADAFTSGCAFNNDGIIQRGEIPAMPGLGGFFEVNPSGSTVTVAVDKDNGAWDFSAAGSSDQHVFEGLGSPSGQWWSADFSKASYSQLVDEANEIYGVYEITDTQLLLLGLVSSSSSYPETEYTYATPIEVLKFPFTKGDTWTTTSTASGWAEGVYISPFAPAVETWTTTVDDSGTVKTPLADFQALRVRVNFTQDYGTETTRIIYLWMAECYGAVARIQSQDGETSADFTTAAEYRRITVP
jgi:hypothetical protein